MPLISAHVCIQMRTRLAQISYDVGDHPVLALDVVDLFVSLARLRHLGCSMCYAVLPASAAYTICIYIQEVR